MDNTDDITMKLTPYRREEIEDLMVMMRENDPNPRGTGIMLGKVEFARLVLTAYKAT